MVPGSPRTYYRHRRRGIRRGRVDHCARSITVDSNCGCPAHVRLSGRRLFGHRDYRQYVHAKPSRGLAAPRRESKRERDRPTRYARLRFIRSAKNVAMVGPLADFVAEYIRGHRCDFTGRTNFSGTYKGHRGGRWRHGWNRESRQRGRTRLLGVAVRPDHTENDLRGHVHSAGLSLLVPAKHHCALDNDHYYFHHSDVLRRWLRHHAGVHGGLLWTEKCRTDLWIDADGMEFC